MSPLVFYATFGIFAASGIAVIFAACVLAKRGDERMQQWMIERQAAARWETQGELLAAEAEAFLAERRSHR